VQGELLRAFAAAGLPRNPVVAGRTDRGVSARMQVLSMRIERDRPLDEVRARLAPHLPVDLGVHLVREVPTGFHAAWSATSKEYRYRLPPELVGSTTLLTEAAAMIPGSRDFRVFHFKTSEVRERTVTSVELLPALTLRFVGEGFARHMVRMLVGGLLSVSSGRVPIEIFAEGLHGQRPFHCPTAPPEPLTLWDVGYPAEVDPFTADERRGFQWLSHDVT
jgi:tRNA pseudouridine38-40 synthase